MDFRERGGSFHPQKEHLPYALPDGVIVPVSSDDATIFGILRQHSKENPIPSSQAETKDVPYVFIAKSKVKKLLNGEFTPASVVEMSNLIDVFTEEVQQKNPQISTLRFSRLLANIVPGKVPHAAQMVARDAVASEDASHRRAGREVLLLLNMKTILTVVEPYLLQCETSEEKEELVHTVVASVTSNFDKPFPDIWISQYVYSLTQQAVAEFFTYRDHFPFSGNIHWDFYRVAEACSYLLADPTAVKPVDIENLAEEVSQETGISVEKLIQYFFHQLNMHHLAPGEDLVEEGDRIWEGYKLQARKDDVDAALATRSKREQQILRLRYGFEGGREWTRGEIAQKLGISEVRVWQIEKEALRLLRYPRVAKKLKDYLE